MSNFYFICGMPRSGSTFLHSLLESIKVAGYVTEFYDSESWDKTIYKETENGVACVKVLGTHFIHIELADFLKAKHIRLKRRDLVKQAISLLLAVKTNRWADDEKKASQTPIKNIQITRKDVEANITWIRDGEMLWDQFFDTHAIKPFTIFYEDLVLNRESIIRETLTFLGIQEAPKLWPPTTYLKKQSNRVNQEIYDWYLNGSDEILSVRN